MEESVMFYSNCTREQAIEALKKSNNNLIEALVYLIQVPPTVCAPKQKTFTPEQEFFKNTRQQLDSLDKSIRDGFKPQDQHESLESSDSQVRHEEKVQQNNCSEGYHPPSPELEVQKQEIVCQSLSEHSYDSLSNDQK